MKREETGVSLNGLNADTVTASVYGRMGGQYGNGSLTVSDAWDRAGSKHLLSSSGNYSSSLIVDRQGLIPGRWGDVYGTGLPGDHIQCHRVTGVTGEFKQRDQ